jgi:hypothetical protein
MSSNRQKATRPGALLRAPGRLRVIVDPGTHVGLLHGNREVSAPPRDADPVAAPGRHDAEAGDAWSGEVRPAGSTDEAGEQGGAIRGGVGGGKRRGREECTAANHGPDTEPGSRVTGAVAHTRSRNQEQEGKADGAPASHQCRRSSVGIPQPEEGSRTGDRRADMGRSISRTTSLTSTSGSSEERIERFPRGDGSSRSPMAGNGRSASPLWRTKLSRALWSRS